MTETVLRCKDCAFFQDKESDTVPWSYHCDKEHPVESPYDEACEEFEFSKSNEKEEG